MMITREAILAHLSELADARNRMQADLYAIQGAMQCCEFWLSKIDEGAGEPAPSEPQEDEEFVEVEES